MVNYTEGKIYKIESTLGDKVYYGSTTKKRLCDRMSTHRSSYNRWLNGKDIGNYSSFDLFNEYGLENCKIILVENCPCESKDELIAREAHYIKSFECVNKLVPGRTLKEYYQDNKNKIKEKKKERYYDNKNKILERNKQYYENNKNKILEKMKIKHTCVCGSCICKGDKAKHERSKKHIKFLESQ